MGCPHSGRGFTHTLPASHVATSHQAHCITFLNASFLPIYLIFSAALRHFPKSLILIFLLISLAFSLLSVSVKTKTPYISSGLATVSPKPGTSISSLCQSPNSLLYPSASAGAIPDHLHAPGTPHPLSDSSTHVISTNWNLVIFLLNCIHPPTPSSMPLF